MEQFIRYLYEYQNGQPARNVGFVKVEKDGAQTVVHIHGKGLQLGSESSMKLYIFFMDGEIPVGILQGTVTNINPAVNYKLTFDGEDTGRPENYPLIKGIIMESAGKRQFAAVWDDSPARIHEMREWDEPEPVPMSVAEAAEAAVSEAGIADNGEEREIPETEASAVEPELRYKKIRRQDIAMLPRCEWRLANNSFLLHGCYNYHHLVLIEDEKESWLGVPGIYHRREARAAEAFGFPRFVRLGEIELALEPDEREPEDDFGYWCRPVKRMNRESF